MKIGKNLLLGLVGAGLFASGVAYADASTAFRYPEAEATLVKAQALLNAITDGNSAENRQKNNAKAEIAKAIKAVECANARVNNPKAACQ